MQFRSVVYAQYENIIYVEKKHSSNIEIVCIAEQMKFYSPIVLGDRVLDIWLYDYTYMTKFTLNLQNQPYIMTSSPFSTSSLVVISSA